MLPDEEQIQFIINRITELESRIAVLEGKEHANGQKKVYTETSEHTFLHAVKEVSKESSQPSENLGFKIFGTVGFIFILLGLFYLYRYAVEQGWIGILERVVLGIIFLWQSWSLEKSSGGRNIPGSHSSLPAAGLHYSISLFMLHTIFKNFGQLLI